MDGRLIFRKVATLSWILCRRKSLYSRTTKWLQISISIKSLTILEYLVWQIFETTTWAWSRTTSSLHEFVKYGEERKRFVPYVTVPVMYRATNGTIQPFLAHQKSHLWLTVSTSQIFHSRNSNKSGIVPMLSCYFKLDIDGETYLSQSTVLIYQLKLSHSTTSQLQHWMWCMTILMVGID